MTAAELQSLVDPIVREAWPPGVTYSADSPMGGGFWAGGVLIWVDHAVLLFEASLTRWLVHRIKWRLSLTPPELIEDNDAGEWHVSWPDTWNQCRRGMTRLQGRGPTLLHALAAAVREAGGERVC